MYTCPGVAESFLGCRLFSQMDSGSRNNIKSCLFKDIEISVLNLKIKILGALAQIFLYRISGSHSFLTGPLP